MGWSINATLPSGNWQLLAGKRCLSDDFAAYLSILWDKFTWQKPDFLAFIILTTTRKSSCIVISAVGVWKLAKYKTTSLVKSWIIALPSVFDVFVNDASHSHGHQSIIPTGHEHHSDT